MNEKYLAGFIDADGHVSVRARFGARPDLEVSISQRTLHRAALDFAQAEFGGSIREKFDGKYVELQMRGSPARQCLERLKKYMVLKRHHAERMIELVDTAFVLKSTDDIHKVRQQVKSIRAFGADRIPNFPSRKWLAGYFDGDGSFNVKVCNKTSYAYPTASILAAKNYTVGLVLLQQAFGGTICSIKQNAFWQLQLSQPSKAKEFLSYFAKHLHIKKPQAYFLLGCAENGNFRDGITIRETIKALNSQQHRLSDPASEAHDLVQQVRFDITKQSQGRPVGIREMQPRKKRQPSLSL